MNAVITILAPIAALMLLTLVWESISERQEHRRRRLRQRAIASRNCRIALEQIEHDKQRAAAA